VRDATGCYGRTHRLLLHEPSDVDAGRLLHTRGGVVAGADAVGNPPIDRARTPGMDAGRDVSAGCNRRCLYIFPAQETDDSSAQISNHGFQELEHLVQTQVVD
jgi:hypothetical protein